MWYNTDMIKIRIIWRNWHLSPLLDIGRYTMHFTSSVVLGVKYWPGDVTYYLGWLIVRKKIKWMPDFVERVNAGTWPDGWMWIVKYGR